MEPTREINSTGVNIFQAVYFHILNVYLAVFFC